MLAAASCNAAARRDWLAALEAAKVPCGAINDLAEVFADPQVRARGMTVDAAPAGRCAAPGGQPDQAVGDARAVPARAAAARRSTPTRCWPSSDSTPRHIEALRDVAARSDADLRPTAAEQVVTAGPSRSEGRVGGQPLTAPPGDAPDTPCDQRHGTSRVPGQTPRHVEQPALDLTAAEPGSPRANTPDADRQRWRELVSHRSSVEIAEPLTAALERIHALTTHRPHRSRRACARCATRSSAPARRA